MIFESFEIALVLLGQFQNFKNTLGHSTPNMWLLVQTALMEFIFSKSSLKKDFNTDIFLLNTQTFSNQLLFQNALEQLLLSYIHFN